MPRRRAARPKPTPYLRDAGDPRGLAALMRRYLEWLAVRNFSPDTIRTREQALHYFAQWCEERSIEGPLEVTKPILERYQRWLYQYRKGNGEPLAFSHQHSRLSAVRGFFKWLTRENYIPSNPASEMDLPRLDHRIPRHVLSVAEVEAVLAQAETASPPGLRDRAILEALYSTGMRRGELCNLKRYDVDVERGTVLIRSGKGRKDRVIPIGERASAWLDKYLLEARPHFVVEPDEGFIFLSWEGKPILPGVLTNLVGKYVRRSGIGKKGSCHLFRHTMATLMLENGADIRFIQEMLGHAVLQTTQVYTQVSIKKLKEIHTLTHPARLGRAEVRGSGLGVGGAKATPDTPNPEPPTPNSSPIEADEEAAPPPSLPKASAHAAPRSTPVAEASTAGKRRSRSAGRGRQARVARRR